MKSGKYDDIIHLPHHVSEKRAPMSMKDRGAQFSPFAALTGYDAAVQEAGRLTEVQMELGEDGVALLDAQLRQLAAQHRPPATITWFCPDSRKAGGSYQCSAGHVLKIDTYSRTVVLEEGPVIPLDSICFIACE